MGIKQSIQSSLKDAQTSAMQNMATTMREVQAEAREEMAEMQRKMMVKQQESMRAMQVALARENVWWFGGLWGLIATGATARYVHTRSVHPAVGVCWPDETCDFLMLQVPIVLVGFVTLYTADLAYGNRMKRVVQHFRHITEEERELIEVPTKKK